MRHLPVRLNGRGWIEKLHHRGKALKTLLKYCITSIVILNGTFPLPLKSITMFVTTPCEAIFVVIILSFIEEWFLGLMSIFCFQPEHFQGCARFRCHYRANQGHQFIHFQTWKCPHPLYLRNGIFRSAFINCKCSRM